MRLTLRTLLAYLDDTLEPAQAKLIGQKVAESEVAQQLVERIKQVTRRRRLTAPPESGPGSLDSNSVAEYLDNVLSADKLAEVEELLLNSDVHLAEVAACHQILTLFLGQPAAVPPTATKRMYGLAKGRQKRPFRKSATPVSEFETGDEEPAKGGGLARLAPLAGVLALIVLLGVALWQIMPGGKTKPGDTGQVAQGGTQPSTEPAVLATKPEKVVPDTKPEKIPPPEDKTPPELKTTDKVPIDKPPVDKPNLERKPVGKFLAVGNAPIVFLSREKDKWQRVKPGAPVSSAETLVSLPGYRTELQLDGGARMLLWGNMPEYSPINVFESSAVLHVPEPPFDIDFTLERGRVVLLNARPDGPVKVKARFHDEVWELTLRDNDSILALEITGWYDAGVPFSRKPGADKPVAQVDMLGLGGTTDVKIRYGKFEMGAPTHYRWRSTGALQRGPQGMPTVPKWFTEPVPNTAQAKDLTLALDELSKRVGVKPVDVALAEARKDGKGASLVLSILSMGAVDDLNELVGALVDDRPEVRWATIYTLTQWSSRKSENDLRLFDALQKNGYSAVQAQTIMDLLHGFSEDDGSKPETFEVLIDYLRHEKLIVREMAWRHLIQLWPDGRKIPYNPAGPADMRERAFDEWKRKIPSGKLPPRGAPASKS